VGEWGSGGVGEWGDAAKNPGEWGSGEMRRKILNSPWGEFGIVAIAFGKFPKISV